MEEGIGLSGMLACAPSEVHTRYPDEIQLVVSNFEIYLSLLYLKWLGLH